MPAVLLCALVVFLAGCTITPQSAPAEQASLPDARDLAEHPLDVLGMPQP